MASAYPGAFYPGQVYPSQLSTDDLVLGYAQENEIVFDLVIRQSQAVFTPPTVVLHAASHDPFWGKLTYEQSISILKEGGSYRPVQDPTNEEADNADVAYIGGRSYVITAEERQALINAGYGAHITTRVEPDEGWHE